MKRIFIFCLIAAGLVACSKDKFKTQPQVEIKEFGPDDEITLGETFTLRAIVRDKEGDLQDSVIFYHKTFNPATMALLSHDSLTRYKLGDFGVPVNDQLEVQLRYSYGVDRPTAYKLYNTVLQDRLLSIGIVVKDNAGHRSDYIESDKILLKKP